MCVFHRVIAGKQRLTSIYAFVTGRMPGGDEFKLTGLEVYEELNGLSFKELSGAMQETIKDSALNAHTILFGCEPDFVFEVFERLNMVRPCKRASKAHTPNKDTRSACAHCSMY